MKKIWLTTILIGSYLALSAQFSISAKYGINSYPDWESIIDGTPYEGDKFIGDGIEYGFSYWFRLKDYRVEFMPEVSFQSLETSNSGDNTPNLNWDFSKQSYYLTFNTLIYTLDIEGDCNCPTWGKDGSFIEKGFFVGISPGIAYHTLETTIVNDPLGMGSTSINKFAFRIGASVGLDIGITKWITITPYATANFTPGLTWDNLQNFVDLSKPGDVATKIWQIQPGLRLTFRPDYLKEQRGMFR